MSRWILSHSFKRDINTDYGIYPENGNDIVMEAVDQNFEYEQQAAGGEDQALEGRSLTTRTGRTNTIKCMRNKSVSKRTRRTVVKKYTT